MPEHEDDAGEIIQYVRVRRGDRYVPLGDRLTRLERVVQVQTIAIAILAVIVLTDHPNVADTIARIITLVTGH